MLVVLVSLVLGRLDLAASYWGVAACLEIAARSLIVGYRIDFDFEAVD